MLHACADELFVGSPGEKIAQLNGVQLEVNRACANLTQAMILTDVGYERSPLGARRIAACH